MLTVATEEGDAFHATDCVRFCVLLSLKVPVAMNCTLPPGAVNVLAGVTAIDVRLRPVTVS